MPYEPLSPDSPLVEQLREGSFEDYLNRTVEFWDKILDRGLEITVPEEKVNDAFRTNLIYDLIARDKVGDQYVQTVNKFQYHAFWLRDSSYIARMYDLSGYHDFAGQVLDFFAKWQQPDGNFVSQGGQFDGWGQVLWAYGRHYRITHGREFAEKVYPSIQKAVSWLIDARAQDPLHLMPSTKPGDNENITGHVTGHNFWALAGLKNAIVIARDLGRDEDARNYQTLYDDYKGAFLVALRKIAAQTSGYMPPGLDQNGGED
jgi:GH15 family glucan-1,4-alpha-glucosidase